MNRAPAPAFTTSATLVLLLSCVALVPTSVQADWPMARHDRERTGAATGTSNLTTPTPYYRYYLGGSLSASQMLTFDVDADGMLDVLMVTGGRVVARTVDDTDLWSSPPRGISAFVGLADLDGDGSEELLARSNNQVVVLNPATGAELWEEPAGEMGTLGGTRLADFDADGTVDLLVAECGCCGVNSGYPGAIYSFSAGFAAARRIFELPEARCGFSRVITEVDVDGAGPPELLLPSANTLRIYSPSTGAMLAESPSLGTRPYWNRCWPAQLDADPGQEIVCVLMENNSALVDRWRVTVFDYASAGALSILWTTVLAPDATGDLRVLDPVVDLDSDGAPELVLAVANSSVWETRIYDAATGTLRATIPNTIAVGHIASSAGLQLVTRSDTALEGFVYAAGVTTPTWSLPDHDVFTSYDFAAAAQRSRPFHLLSLDLDADGMPELLTTEPTATGSRMVAYAIDGSSATEVASYALAAGTDAQSAWVIPPVTPSNSTLAVAYTDGFMIIHDSLLSPSVASGEFDPARLRTGGYYASGRWRDLRRSPVTAALEPDAGDAIIVSDARGALLRLDANFASWGFEPLLRWERLYTSAPTIVPGLAGGGPGIACLSVRDPQAEARQFDVTVLAPDGSTHWSVPTSDVPILDLVPASLDGDAIPDLVFHWGSRSDTLLQTRAISGADGSLLWDMTPIETGAGRQPAGIAIGRFDGDDRDDIYFEGGATRVLSGADGTQLASFPGPAYFLPTLVDIDGDSTREVVLHGGQSPINVLSADLSAQLWTSIDDDRPYPYGSVARCATDRVVLVSTSWGKASRLKRTELSGGALGTESSTFLAGGRAFTTRADVDAAGVFAGQLTSVAVHSNLAGDGTPAALVGSTDGWLYWVDPCDGTLVHAIDFGVAVGQTVFADTNGDGLDELLVSAADGYLYGLKQRNIERPAWVNDIDPADPSGMDDVDLVNTRDTLIGRWAAVPGAVRYEVGVFYDGAPLLADRWQDVGTDTEVTLAGLSLINGRRYAISVRAISAAGPSVDAVSDGAIVRFPVSDDAGTPGVDASTDDASTPGADAGTPTDGSGGSGGCGCRVTPSSDARPWALFLFALALASVWRRRRRG
ncbi:MAG: VCBS repeat-containing protein [Deltaproteobacteria bacterium]|nr:VCBS repeat-containing protein [Deltaproteobacteria bacterium]